MPRRKIIPYNPKLKQIARVLRNNSTVDEIVLWKCLKGKQMRGYDFHRQKPLNNYIVDFFCHELMLAIEIDGESHHLRKQEDKLRQEKLEKLGIQFLRFSDTDIRYHLPAVIYKIESWIDANNKKE